MNRATPARMEGFGERKPPESSVRLFLVLYVCGCGYTESRMMPLGVRIPVTHKHLR